MQTFPYYYEGRIIFLGGGERMPKCKYCNNSFNSEEDLLDHIQRMHRLEIAKMKA